MHALAKSATAENKTSKPNRQSPKHYRWAIRLAGHDIIILLERVRARRRQKNFQGGNRKKDRKSLYYICTMYENRGGAGPAPPLPTPMGED